MKRRHLTAAAALLPLAAMLLPATIMAASIHDGIKWTAVAGKLTSYSPGTGASVSVTSAKRTAHRDTAFRLNVALSFTTKLRFGSTIQAPPLVAPGDGVRINLKWTGSAAHVVSFTYLAHGTIPGASVHSGEQAASRFHGTYTADDSVANSTLALSNWKHQEQKFALTPDTIYFEAGQQIATPALADGEHLAVEASQQSDGSWAANTVIVRDHSGDHGALGAVEEFHGYYQSSTATTMTMTDKSGAAVQTFTVGPKTEFLDQYGNLLPSLAYSGGQRCHVVAVQLADGTWLARRIRQGANDPGGNGQNHGFHGSFVSNDGDSLTLTDPNGNTETFNVGSSTLYFNKVGKPVASLNYAVGRTVWLQASHQLDGTWLANQVSLSKPSSPTNPTENFPGMYESNSDSSLTLLVLGGTVPITFTTNSNTMYYDGDGNAVSSLTYSASEPLEVEAVEQSDGSWLATMVTAFVASKGADS